MSESLAGLRAAFDSLLPLAAPERAEAVLRRALIGLLAVDDAPGKLLVERSPAVSTIDAAGWREDLRPRLRAQLDLAGQTLGDLAEQTGIPRSTLEKTLSPNGVVPGKLIADKLSTWLAAQGEPEAPDRPSGGVRRPRPRERPAPAEDMAQAVAASPTPPAAPSGGVKPGRLSEAQRTALSPYLSFDDQQTKARFGVTRELLHRVAAGGEFAPEVIERVAHALANGAA